MVVPKEPLLTTIQIILFISAVEGRVSLNVYEALSNPIVTAFEGVRKFGMIVSDPTHKLTSLQSILSMKMRVFLGSMMIDGVLVRIVPSGS